jgi:ribonuclease-3 family protein
VGKRSRVVYHWNMDEHPSSDRQDPGQMSGLALAFVGDGVWHALVRAWLASRKAAGVQALHREAVGYVRASAQAQALSVIQPVLTQEESDIARRGRNAQGNAPRNVDVQTYRLATGFEALVGYLYLMGREDRLKELSGMILKER